MTAPDIETSTREERLEFIRDEFRCLGNCPICGKCSFLRGREAEDLYAVDSQTQCPGSNGDLGYFPDLLSHQGGADR